MSGSPVAAEAVGGRRRCGAAIDGRTGKPGDPRDHRKPAPAGRSHLARREHPPPAFVKLRADHVPAIANRIFIDHPIRDTSVRLDPESRRPEPPSRTSSTANWLLFGEA